VKAGYSILTGAEVSLSAATTKTVLGVKSHANFGLDLTMVGIHALASGTSAPGFEPILVELIYCTWATNSPGTNSTSVTPIQEYGRSIAVGFTAARSWSSEPTAVTSIIDEFMVHPQTGWQVWRPFGATPDCAVSEGFVLRCNSDNAVSIRAMMRVERC
jgi:hypothetical protein